MKISLHIALRHYGETLVIGQVLDSLALSSAAASAEQARERLRSAAIAALERAHPRMLAQLGHLAPPEQAREQLPVYTGHEGFARRGEAAKHLPLATDVLTRRYGDLVHLQAPALSRSVWSEGGDDARQRGLDRLAKLCHRQERTLRLHRAVPDRLEVETLEVEFTPLDLTRMPADTLWLDAFAEVDGSDRDESGSIATLADVAQDWTLDDEQRRRERQLVPAFDRDELLDQIRQLVFGRQPAAVVIVGPPRSGKTSLARHLAWESAVHPERADARHLWFADAPRLTSTDPMSGGWQEQCAKLVDELEQIDHVLYLGRLVQTLDAGKYVGSDYNLAQFLKPHLSDRRLRVVAEATVQEWNRIEQRDVGFARAFNVIRLEDPPDATARRIVSKAAARMSESEGIELSGAAVDRAWRLQKRFATEGSPVGRAIDFIGRSLRRAAQAFRGQVTDSDIVERFCDETGLPPVMLLDDRKLDLDDVQRRLSRRVMGQDEAVRRVAHVVGITKAGLAPADRPLGSFFFVGPTGVGKTELARALAEFLFGDEDRLVRLDMSEYSHPDAYSRLLGEGKEEGDLTGPVRRQPFSVVLLDEVEKAHSSVYDLLLQVLGEARLTDADGRTTRFQNTIVIMTSNLGVDTLKPSIGFGGEASDEAWEHHFKREAERHFRPEFLARIDQFMPFRSLSREVIEAIARREIDKLISRDGLAARDIEVEFADEVIAWVAARGWDEQYGARPIKRVVEQRLAWPMAAHLANAAAEEVVEPGAAIRVRVELDGSVEHGELSFGVVELDEDRAAQSRRTLLHQVEKIAGMRRRLERCMYGELFAELEWQVHDFDTSSQASGFWELSDAAEMARSAEKSRDLVESTHELSRELEAIEDLVREAYYTRTFELIGDIDERVAQIEPGLQEVFLELLRSAFEQPDRVVLFLPSSDPRDPWREQLVRWYRQLAHRRGWRLSMRRAVPRRERTDKAIEEGERREELWQHARKPSGTVLALEFEGLGVRPLLQGEDGLHRRIHEDGNATAEIFVLTENLGWPRPSDLESERPTRPTARTWNFRTEEVRMRGLTGLPLDEENPWSELWSGMEDIAWELAGADWW